MLSPERCPGPEEVGPEEVQEQRECKSGGRSSQRKVRSWTWKCPKPLVDLPEEVEQEQEQN